MGKLTYIITLWQAICDYLEEKEHSTCTFFIPGTVRIRGTMRYHQWPVFSSYDKARAMKPVGCRQDSVCITCPVELTEAEKYWSRRKSTLYQITFYSSLNKNFLGCLQLSWLSSWFIVHKCMHRAILLMMFWEWEEVQREEWVCTVTNIQLQGSAHLQDYSNSPWVSQKTESAFSGSYNKKCNCFKK